jgi:hypothetical protein
MQEITQKLSGDLRILNLTEMWEVYRLWGAEHTAESLKRILIILHGDDVDDLSPSEIASSLFLGLYKNGIESFQDFVKSMVV